MDLDPELDVTLSDGRESVTFRIAAVEGALEVWAILEPFALMRVVVGRVAALETRARVDTLIAERLAAGWVPLDPLGAVGPLAAPAPVPPDLGLQIGSLLDALAEGRAVLGAADPTGHLWAACARLMQQARRFGIGAPRARVGRAQRERRLGELAEQAGDMPAAILHYRAALAAHPGVGVWRRLARLAPHWSTPTDRDAPDREGTAADVLPALKRTKGAAAGVTGRAPTQTAAAPRGRGDARESRPRFSERRCAQEKTTMAKKPIAKVQLVCRIDSALNEKVRAHAARAGQTLTTFIERALARATTGKPHATETHTR